CADEFVVRAVEPLNHRLEAWNRARDQVARRDAFARGGLLHLEPVLVGAGEEKNVVAVEPLKARDRIGRDHLIGVTDVRRTVRIRDRRRDVIGLRHRGLTEIVMPGLEPGIHALDSSRSKTWMAGSSPAMTSGSNFTRLQRAASARSPNTAKTIGFRSR